MPKHNIDAIARVAYESKRAWSMGSSPIDIRSLTPKDVPPSWDELAEEDQKAVRVDVLEAIHGAPRDQDGGTENERRVDRLFAAIVKALTVRM
jgi:hypothetical protein